MIDIVMDNPARVAPPNDDQEDYCMGVCCACGGHLYAGDFVYEIDSPLPFGGIDTYCEDCMKERFGKML